MRANITLITTRLHCSEEHALAVERYMDENAMVDWSEDSARTITTLARAVSEHLLRGEVKVIQKEMPAPRKPVEKKAKVARKPAKKGGTKIEAAMAIYKKASGSRQEIITAIAEGMGLERHAAAGYYQSCKRKLG